METAVNQLIQTIIAEEAETAELISKANARQIEFLLKVLATIRSCLEKYVSIMIANNDVNAAKVVAFLLCKVIRTGRAARVLCSAGWGVEAELVLRPALEALINLLYIAQTDSENRAILYSEFDHMSAKAYADRVDRWPELFKDVDLQSRRNEIKENFDRVKANYPMKDFWAGKLIKGRLREMAKQVGLEWYYDFMYWFSSNHIHANARSAMEVMRVTPDQKAFFDVAPSERNTQHALLLATDFLIRAYGCIVQFFKLPEEGSLTDLIAGYGALYRGFQAR